MCVLGSFDSCFRPGEENRCMARHLQAISWDGTPMLRFCLNWYDLSGQTEVLGGYTQKDQ